MASAEVSAQSDVPPAAAGPELPRLGAAAGGMPCYDAQSVAARVACLRGCAAAAAPAAVEGDGGDGVDESAAAGGGAAHAGVRHEPPRGASARAGSRGLCPTDPRGLGCCICWARTARARSSTAHTAWHYSKRWRMRRILFATHPPFPFHFAAFALAAFFSAAYFFICACSASHAAAPPGKVSFIACMAPSLPLKETCESVQCFHLKM